MNILNVKYVTFLWSSITIGDKYLPSTFYNLQMPINSINFLIFFFSRIIELKWSEYSMAVWSMDWFLFVAEPLIWSPPNWTVINCNNCSPLHSAPPVSPMLCTCSHLCQYSVQYFPQMIVGWLPLLLLHPICLHFQANSLVLGAQPLFEPIFGQRLPLVPIFWAQKSLLNVVFCPQHPDKALSVSFALVTIVPAPCLPQHDIIPNFSPQATNFIY